MISSSHEKPIQKILMGFLNSRYSIPAFTFLVFIFYLITLQDGHNWGGDFSHYIHHAKNISEGKPYLDTLYIKSGLTMFTGPYAYPPVFPLFLTPVYWLSGMDINTMKIVCIVFLGLTLLITPQIFNQQLNQLQKVSIVLFIGFNACFWEHRNHILSDFTFLFFCYFSLYIMLTLFHPENYAYNVNKRYIFNPFTLGLAMYLAYGTREIGIVLPLTVITYEIIQSKKITSISLISVLVFSLLFYCQMLFLQGNFTPENIQINLRELAERQQTAYTYSHLDLINLNPASILERIDGYRWSLQLFWPPNDSPSFDLLNTSILKTITLVAALGYCLTLTKKITVLEIFFSGYIATLLFFNAPPTERYLFPLFPLMLYYSILAYKKVVKSEKLKRAISAAAFFLIFISYSHSIYTYPNEHLENGINHPDATGLFDFIRNNTAKTDIIVSEKPRIIALMTQRPSASHPHKGTSAELTNAIFDAMEADYYIDANLNGGFSPLTESSPPTSRFSEVFRNNRVAVYQYKQ